MINLFPNFGYGAKFGLWTPTVTGSATVPVGTYSATSGPDNTPGITLSATGTSGGIELVSAKFSVSPEDMLFLSVVCKASSVTPTLTPYTVAFSDALAGSVVTVTPIAAAGSASTNAIQYNSLVAVPVGAVYAVVVMGWLAWTSTGGYSVVVSSPIVGHA